MEENTNKTIHQRLSTIQKTLKSPKDRANSHGGFKYRSAEDILAEIKNLLEVESDEYILVDISAKHIEGRFYVIAEASFVKGNTKITATACAREGELDKSMNVSQLTGSTSSYAKKYALCNLFAIDDEKDPDEFDNSKGHNSKDKPPIKKESHYDYCLKQVRNGKKLTETEKNKCDERELENLKTVHESLRAKTTSPTVDNNVKKTSSRSSNGTDLDPNDYNN